ncbi:hypothetical protein TNCV_4873791 [Trichonephila clavipes]|nr:hypothetical protein TNCV_4873791 [Trichonephila clavipes]
MVLNQTFAKNFTQQVHNFPSSVRSYSIMLKLQIRILLSRWPQNVFDNCSVRSSRNCFRSSILILEEICHTVSRLSSVQIFRLTPLPGWSAAEPSSSKRLTRLLIMKTMGAHL